MSRNYRDDRDYDRNHSTSSRYSSHSPHPGHPPAPNSSGSERDYRRPGRGGSYQNHRSAGPYDRPPPPPHATSPYHNYPIEYDYSRDYQRPTSRNEMYSSRPGPPLPEDDYYAPRRSSSIGAGPGIGAYGSRESVGAGDYSRRRSSGRYPPGPSYPPDVSVDYDRRDRYGYPAPPPPPVSAAAPPPHHYHAERYDYEPPVHPPREHSPYHYKQPHPPSTPSGQQPYHSSNNSNINNNSSNSRTSVYINYENEKKSSPIASNGETTPTKHSGSTALKEPVQRRQSSSSVSLLSTSSTTVLTGMQQAALAKHAEIMKFTMDHENQLSKIRKESDGNRADLLRIKLQINHLKFDLKKYELDLMRFDSMSEHFEQIFYDA